MVFCIEQLAQQLADIRNVGTVSDMAVEVDDLIVQVEYGGTNLLEGHVAKRRVTGAMWIDGLMADEIKHPGVEDVSVRARKRALKHAA